MCVYVPSVCACVHVLACVVCEISYRLRVTNLKMNSQTRWFLQMSKQIVRLICSYQHATDDPNAIIGHTLLGATLLSTYCVPCSPFGTGKYG